MPGLVKKGGQALSPYGTSPAEDSRPQLLPKGNSPTTGCSKNSSGCHLCGEWNLLSQSPGGPYAHWRLESDGSGHWTVLERVPTCVPSQRAWNANGVHSGITQKRRQEARSSHSCDPWLRPSLLSAVHAHAAQARGSALQAPAAPDPARETGTLTAALRLNQPGPWEEQGSFLCRQGSLPTHPHCTPANTTDARKLSQPLEKLNAF